MVWLRMDSRHFGHWPESGGETDSRASDLRLHEQQPGMDGHSLDRRFTNNGFLPSAENSAFILRMKSGDYPLLCEECGGMFTA